MTVFQTCPKTKQSQCSKVSKGSASTSSSTSARIKAMAERAALLQHAAAMEKTHTLEEEEERLRIQSERLKRQKEQLMMNAKIAANDARLSVLKTSDVGRGKKASSDYSKRKKSHSLNPDSQVHLPGNSTQVAMHCITTQQAAGIQDGTAVVQNNPVSHSQLHIHSLRSPVHPPTDVGQGILYNIMQQQANITAQLLHRADYRNCCYRNCAKETSDGIMKCHKPFHASGLSGCKISTRLLW